MSLPGECYPVSCVVSESRPRSISPVKLPGFFSRLLFCWVGACLVLLAPGCFAATGDENWDRRFCLPGVDGQVYTTLTIGSRLYVAGSFAKAGGYQAYNFGRWTDPGLGPRVWFGAFSNSTLQVTWPAADSDFTLQHATAITSSNIWTAVTTAGTTNGGFRIVTLPATNQSEFFRLLHP